MAWPWVLGPLGGPARIGRRVRPQCLGLAFSLVLEKAASVLITKWVFTSAKRHFVQRADANPHSVLKMSFPPQQGPTCDFTSRMSGFWPLDLQVDVGKNHKMQEPYWWEHTFRGMVGEASCAHGGSGILIGGSSTSSRNIYKNCPGNPVNTV